MSAMPAAVKKITLTALLVTIGYETVPTVLGHTLPRNPKQKKA